MLRAHVLPVVSRPATAPRNASRQWPQRAGLVLRISDEQGRTGWGEASPLPGYSQEPLAVCQATLQGWAQGPLPALGPDEDQALAQVSLASQAVASGGAAAACAVASALLDLLGQQRQRSAAELLRRGWPIPSLSDAPAPPLELSALLSGDNQAALLDAARAALAAGFRTLKVKIGGPDSAAELAALTALRHMGGDQLSLRLDANQSLSPDEAARRLTTLALLRPELVEEPLAPPVDAAQLRLLARLGVPLALDESLQTSAAEALIDHGGCAAVVLKPMALGLLRSRELARHAQLRGLRIIVTHLFDGPIGLATAAALAESLRRDGLTLLPCGLAPHPALAGWPPWPAQRDPVAWLRRSVQGPGLGFAAPAGWPEAAA